MQRKRASSSEVQSQKRSKQQDEQSSDGMRDALVRLHWDRRQRRRRAGRESVLTSEHTRPLTAKTPRGYHTLDSAVPQTWGNLLTIGGATQAVSNG